MEAKDTALSFLKPAIAETLKWFRAEFKVDLKEDQSPVTIADKNTEEILRRHILKNFPGHGIIGEEFGSETEKGEWVWTVDPIDGTRSFIRGLPFYSILISLLHYGEPVIGIVSFPALGETYWGVKGQGAYCGDSKIKVSEETQITNSLVATADRYCFKEKECLFLLEYLSREASLIRTYPDAFGHILAIRGAVDVMVDPWAYIWDFAPLKVLAEEAGGSFINFRGEKNDIREGSAIVGNKSLVKSVKSVLVKEG